MTTSLERPSFDAKKIHSDAENDSLLFSRKKPRRRFPYQKKKLRSLHAFRYVILQKYRKFNGEIFYIYLRDPKSTLD